MRDWLPERPPEPIIVSERQAEEIGKARTGGQSGRDFIVYHYKQSRTGLTLFGVEIKATGERIHHAGR